MIQPNSLFIVKHKNQAISFLQGAQHMQSVFFVRVSFEKRFDYIFDYKLCYNTILKYSIDGKWLTIH